MLRRLIAGSVLLGIVSFVWQTGTVQAQPLTKQAIQEHVKNLGSNDDFVWRSAGKALVEGGPDAVVPLLAARQDAAKARNKLAVERISLILELMGRAQVKKYVGFEVAASVNMEGTQIALDRIVAENRTGDTLTFACPMYFDPKAPMGQYRMSGAWGFGVQGPGGNLEIATNVVGIFALSAAQRASLEPVAIVLKSKGKVDLLNPFADKSALRHTIQTTSKGAALKPGKYLVLARYQFQELPKPMDKDAALAKLFAEKVPITFQVETAIMVGK